MAPRKKPELGPVLDSKSEDKSKILLVMPEPQFNSVIRLIRGGSIDRVIQVSTATKTALGKLGLKRDKSAVVKGKMPKGSDQVDIQSLIVWMNKITKRNRNALAQLLAIDATCGARGA